MRNLLTEGKICDANNLLINKYTIFADEINVDFNKNIAFTDNKSSIVIPADGRYRILAGSKEMMVTIRTDRNGSVLIFDKKLEKNDDIVFLDRII